MSFRAPDGLIGEMPKRSPIDCNVSTLAADVASVDSIARVQLVARRLGLEIRLHHASADLRGLIDFLGLLDALGVEVERQAEQREQGLRVEEERELDDPAV
jgi:hypothetical protein